MVSIEMIANLYAKLANKMLMCADEEAKTSKNIILNSSKLFKWNQKEKNCRCNKNSNNNTELS